MFYLLTQISIQCIILQVNELRQELVARNSSSKGLKSQLLARLLKAVKSEQAKEEGRQDEADENEEDVSLPSKEEDDKKFRDVSENEYDVKKMLYIFISHGYGI